MERKQEQGLWGSQRKGQVGKEAETDGWSRTAKRRKRRRHGVECGEMYFKYLSVGNTTTCLMFSGELSFKQQALICFYGVSGYSEVPSYPILCSPSGSSLMLPFSRKFLPHSWPG